MLLLRRSENRRRKVPAMKALFMLLAFWGLAASTTDLSKKDAASAGIVSPVDPVGEGSPPELSAAYM